MQLIRSFHGLKATHTMNTKQRIPSTVTTTTTLDF